MTIIDTSNQKYRTSTLTHDFLRKKYADFELKTHFAWNHPKCRFLLRYPFWLFVFHLFICFMCLYFGVGVQGVILRPLSGPFRGLRRPGRNLTPFNRTFPRVASKTTYSKVLVPIWFIWCQTCPGVPEPLRNHIFIRLSPPIFVHLVALWPWLPFFGNQKPLKNYCIHS